MKKSFTQTQTHANDIVFTDVQIVKMIRSNEQAKQNKALTYLLYRDVVISNIVKSLVLKHGGNSQDTDDILQEGVLALFNMIQKPKFELKAKLSTIMYSICQRVWLKEQKRRKRFVDIEEQAPIEMKKSQTIPVPHFSELDDIEYTLSLLLEKLPRKQKLAVEMRHLEGLPYKELQTALEYKSYEVTKNAVCRGVKQLQRIVDRKPLLRQMLLEFRQSA